MNSASSLPRYAQALATSCGVELRPSGIVAMNGFSFSFLPRNKSVLKWSVLKNRRDLTTHKPVPRATTGQTELKRILSGAYSTAMVLVALITAALEALYHVNPGLGRMPAVDAIEMKTPPFFFSCMIGTMTLAE
jgi:hypothetical protein